MVGDSRGAGGNGAGTTRRRRAAAVLWCLVLVTAGAGGVAAASAATTGGGSGELTAASGVAGGPEAGAAALTAGDAAASAAGGVSADGNDTATGDGSANATWTVDANSTAGSPLTPAPTGDLAVSNPHLVAYVDDDAATRGGLGTFTLQAAAPDGDGAVDLLYGGGDAWSSYLSVRVDDRTYVTGREVLGARNMDGYVTQRPTVDGDRIVTEWTLPEDVVVTQTVTLDGPRARFAVEVENADGWDHDVRARFLFDYQLGAADGSPVQQNGSRVTTETVVDNPGVGGANGANAANASVGNASLDAWRVGDDPSASGPAGVATARTAPTRVAFTRWNPAYGSPYAYDADPDAEFYNASRDEGDGAGLVYYEFGTVAAGESAVARTAYGPDVPERSAALYVPDQTTRGGTVTVGGASLPYGGFLAVYDDDGDLRGVSEELPAAGVSNVTVTLDDPLLASESLSVVAYRDTNGNDRPDLGAAGGDDPYAGEDGPTTERAYATLAGPFGAATDFGDQTTDGRTVTVDSVNLSAGGFVALRTPSGAADDPGSIVGVSEYLRPGTHENVRVEAYRVPGGQFTRLSFGEDQRLVAVPYRDTNDNKLYDFLDSDGAADRPYAGGDAVDDEAYVTVVHGGSADDDDGGSGDSGGHAVVSDTEPTYYQVDLAAGQPIDNLGERLYAEEDRLVRWALGNTDDGISGRGTAWPDESVRACVDAGQVRREGATARVSFTVADGCSNVTLTFASYTMVDADFSPETADQQVLFDATTEAFGPGEHTVTVALPDDE
ncbi:DUF7282 domain-containing protein [Candidatus Halobonum tyrrellensis]|uniref:DUF7282 domain-containing protein n=1 Tax=Candidatus Halobonum tyrrellensis G22 TaxID=1324957 RepID=V4HH16_9EURY|nr:hypothetical protein [Candidatus Halobonum tyrrellensis]ESP87139.1 hypothetical protein K933_15460 [Candidatus Halobonum tyrrellensis G22]